MITPGFFENEEQSRGEKKESSVKTLLSLVIRNLQTMLTDLFGRNVFKVKIEEQSTDALLKKIIGQLHSVLFYLKPTSGVSQSPKISIKTPDLVTLNKSIEEILKRIEAKELKVNIPSISKVSGTVKVDNFPSQYPFEKLYGALSDIKYALGNIRLEIPPQREIKFPDIKMPQFPKSLSMTESRAILGALKDVKDALEELPKKLPQVEIPKRVSIDNFPPTKYPMPVTNININPLRGFAKSRTVTITTSITPLPEEVLSNRRSLVIYNNSDQTIYVGGSDVTTSNGLPVPAGTFSPAFDSGPRMIIYGIVASSTAEVRTLELSNENIGG